MRSAVNWQPQSVVVNEQGIEFPALKNMPNFFRIETPLGGFAGNLSVIG